MSIRHYVLAGLAGICLAGCGVNKTESLEARGEFPLPPATYGGLPVGGDGFPSAIRYGQGWGIAYDQDLDGFVDAIVPIEGNSSAEIYNAQKRAKEIDISQITNHLDD